MSSVAYWGSRDIAVDVKKILLHESICYTNATDVHKCMTYNIHSADSLNNIIHSYSAFTVSFIVTSMNSFSSD
jgi:hypothetical protein